MISTFAGLVMLAVTLGTLAVQVFAFVDATIRRPDAFVAADKMTKPAWMVILGLCVLANMLLSRGGPMSLFNLVGTIAALVYVLDVRPAVRALTR